VPVKLPLIGKVNKPVPWAIGLITAGILLSSTTAYFFVHRSSSKIDLAKLTVPAKAENLRVQITASGTIVPVQSVNLSPKTAGRLAHLYVEQGDRVQQGQIIARMDSTDIQAQRLQAQAQLAQAEAQLAQARAGSRPEEIAQARARLAQAEAKLAQARAGNRSEEIAQARAQVEAAQAKVNLTSTRVNRYRYLTQQGAESRDRLDEVITDDRSARASLRETQRNLDLLQRGTRPEEIAQAEATVAEARQAYQQAQKGSRPEEIAQAEATVAEAAGRLQEVEAQVADTVIRAPFAGLVTQKYATAGAFVTPTTSASDTTSATSTSIVALAKGLEVLAKVPEVDIGQIKKGQPVEIVADAYPDQVFKGRVRLVSPEAVEELNVTSFEVRVEILTGLEQLRSGMNTDLTFLGDTLQNALVVPTVAIATQKGKTGVYLPGENNKPQFQPVTIGSSIQDQTQVLKGLKQGERVFIDFPEDQKPQEPEK
jgi:HlyD family secretion protein